MTKIKISDKEIYNLEIPAEMGRKELDYVISRLVFVQRLMSKDPLAEAIEGETPKSFKFRQPSGLKLKMLDTREDTVKALRLYYLEDNKDKLSDFFEKIGVGKIDAPKKREIISTKLKAMRIKFNIKPKEVGMKAYPKAGQSIRYKELRLK